MQASDYGLTSRLVKLKDSQVRPKSQHRSSSLTHNDSLKKQPSSKPSLVTRRSMQASTAAEYYTQEVQRRPFREFCMANKANIRTVREQAQNLQKVRRQLIQKLQRWMLGFRQQIHRQSAQIFNLERIIERQAQQIQTKNSILMTLIAKMQESRRDSKVQDLMCLKRVNDLEAKIRIIVQQIDEEREHNYEKIQELRGKVIKYFGIELWKLKQSLCCFLQEKERKISQIDKQMASLCIPLQLKQTQSDRSTQIFNTSLKSTQKYSFSTPSQPQESFFFYPDNSTLRTIQELIREREQLPIRVFTDSSGRLKYWQSGTFIFDRRGNFSLPSSQEITCMQQRGWIKLIAFD